MKVQQKAMALLGVALMLVSATTLLAQKGSTGKSTTIELSAQFRDAITDKIHSDGLGPYISNRFTPSYPNDVTLTTSGWLYMRIQKNRNVILEFNQPVRPAPMDAQGQVLCREYALLGADPFTYPAPTYLANGTGIPDIDMIQIVTGGEFKFNAGAGVWDYSQSYFNLATMPVGFTPAYVGIAFQFHTVEEGDIALALPGYELWADTPYTGIAKVTHPDSNTWVLEPLPAGNPDAPLRSIGPDGMSLSLSAPSIKRVRSGGYCDLGDWTMPFQLTLHRR